MGVCVGGECALNNIIESIFLSTRSTKHTHTEIHTHMRWWAHFYPLAVSWLNNFINGLRTSWCLTFVGLFICLCCDLAYTRAWLFALAVGTAAASGAGVAIKTLFMLSSLECRYNLFINAISVWLAVSAVCRLTLDAESAHIVVLLLLLLAFRPFFVL